MPGKQLVEAVDVVDDANHDLARAAAVKEGKGKILNVGKQILTQRGDRLASGGIHQSHAPAQAPCAHHDRRDHADDQVGHQRAVPVL